MTFEVENIYNSCFQSPSAWIRTSQSSWGCFLLTASSLDGVIFPLFFLMIGIMERILWILWCRDYLVLKNFGQTVTWLDSNSKFYFPMVCTGWNNSVPSAFQLLHFTGNCRVSPMDQPGIWAESIYRCWGFPYCGSLLSWKCLTLQSLWQSQMPFISWLESVTATFGSRSSHLTLHRLGNAFRQQQNI